MRRSAAAVLLMLASLGATDVALAARKGCGVRSRSVLRTAIDGVPQSCRAATSLAKVTVYAAADTISRVVVKIDGRVIARGKARTTEALVDCSDLAAGEHRFKVTAHDTSGRMRATTRVFVVLR